MGHCKDCKWWVKRYDIVIHDAENFKECRRYMDGPYPDKLVLCTGGADAEAEMWTAPDFGCVQFEAEQVAIQTGKLD